MARTMPEQEDMVCLQVLAIKDSYSRRNLLPRCQLDHMLLLREEDLVVVVVARVWVTTVCRTDINRTWLFEVDHLMACLAQVMQMVSHRVAGWYIHHHL